MLHKFLASEQFHALLTAIDADLAKEIQQKGCPHCGEKLDNSNYSRSPFGVAAPFRPYYQTRRSLCCRKCRKRTPSPTVRFFGRRWYCAPFFLFINALIGKQSRRRITAVQQHIRRPISKRTWQRWRYWWCEYFPTLPFWKKMKGLIPIHAIRGPFPYILLAIRSGRLEERITTLLQFLAPITAGALCAV